jgi:hypothetical protein
MGPQTRLVTLGVNSLARATGLPRQTVSDRMRKGATPAEIRLYAAMRESRRPERKPAAVATRSEARKFRQRRLEVDAALQARGIREAIDDARLRRVKALAEKQELENQHLHSQVIPRLYLEEWTKRFLPYAREMMLEGPSELSEVLATVADPLKCSEFLRSWVTRIMARLAETDEL